MANKAQTPKTTEYDPFAPANAIGSDVTTHNSSGGFQAIYINYDLGAPRSADGPARSGYFYFKDQDGKYNLPSPWEKRVRFMGGEETTIWRTHALHTVLLQNREAREVKVGEKERYLFYVRVPKTQMFNPRTGEHIGDYKKAMNRQLAIVLLSGDDEKPVIDLGLPVIMSAKGTARGFMLSNTIEILGKDWYHPDMGLGILDETIDYTVEARRIMTERRGYEVLFRTMGNWKCVLAPETDDKGEPVFYPVGRAPNIKMVNPYRMFIDDDPERSAVVANRGLALYVNQQYTDWVDAWVKEWDSQEAIEASRSSYVGSSGDSGDDEVDNLSGSKHTAYTERDEIPF